MIRQIIWFAALMIIALLTIGVQLDRQSAVNPTLAAVVPEPFRAFAQAHIAVSASEGDDPAAALAEARRLIQRRPVPAEHLTLLAISQTKANLLDEAEVSIQIAAQRGWRDPLAQEAVLRLALAADDDAEAARRYIALLRQADTSDALLTELGSQVFAQPHIAARKTSTDIFIGAERWHNLFLRRGARVMPPDAFAEIVTASAARGLQFDCIVLKQAKRTLSQRDENAGRALATIEKDCATS